MNTKTQKTKVPVCTLPTTPLRTMLLVFTPNGEHHHTLKFDYANLNERWPALWRMEDCLRQGYQVALSKIDPRVERLAKKFPLHG